MDWRLVGRWLGGIMRLMVGLCMGFGWGIWMVGGGRYGRMCWCCVGFGWIGLYWVDDWLSRLVGFIWKLEHPTHGPLNTSL